MSNASQQTSTKKAGVGCATTKQSFLGQRSAGFVLPVLRISEEVEPKSKARAEEEKTVDHEEVLPLEGGKKVVRGEFAVPSSDDTGLAAGATSGGAFPLSAHGKGSEGHLADPSERQTKLSKCRSEEEPKDAKEDQEETSSPGRGRRGRGEFAEPSSVDTGLAAGSSCGGAFPLSQEPPNEASTSQAEPLRSCYPSFDTFTRGPPVSGGYAAGSVQLTQQQPDLGNYAEAVAQMHRDIAALRQQGPLHGIHCDPIRAAHAYLNQLEERFAGTDATQRSCSQHETAESNDASNERKKAKYEALLPDQGRGGNAGKGEGSSQDQTLSIQA